MPMDLVTVVARLADVNADIVTADAAGDHDRVRALVEQAADLEQRRNFLLHRPTRTKPNRTRYETAVPTRDRIIQTLQVAGRPASAKLIADLSRAVLAAALPSNLPASLRRDEQRSWRSAHDQDSRVTPRDIYVVPALAADRLTPVRATLALSSWPTPVRLITPSSPRVDLLHVVVSLADVIARNRAADPDAAGQLLRRLSRSLPGFTGWDAPDHPGTVRDAARNELEAIGPRDDEERDAAADRAENQLDAEQLLFGAQPLAATDLNRRRAR